MEYLSSRPWSTMALDHLHRPWLAMMPFNKTWSKHVRPWLTLVDHGCMTMEYHGVWIKVICKEAVSKGCCKEANE